MEPPVCLPYEQFAALRPERSVPALFERLWVCGSLDGLRKPVIAIVGTRAATAYGKAAARCFARDLSRAGCCIISGLALGIDTAAHRGALEEGAATVGVLGSGHEQFFPLRNAKLAQEMIAIGGAVLSPFEPQQQSSALAVLGTQRHCCGVGGRGRRDRSPRAQRSIEHRRLGRGPLAGLRGSGRCRSRARGRLSRADSRRCNPGAQRRGCFGRSPLERSGSSGYARCKLRALRSAAAPSVGTAERRRVRSRRADCQSGRLHCPCPGRALTARTSGRRPAPARPPLRFALTQSDAHAGRNWPFDFGNRMLPKLLRAPSHHEQTARL